MKGRWVAGVKDAKAGGRSGRGGGRNAVAAALGGETGADADAGGRDGECWKTEGVEGLVTEVGRAGEGVEMEGGLFPSSGLSERRRAAAGSMSPF